ncbi:vWA domain-containing protein [Glaciecola sp. 1036]|uniref:vWA domain-containing protein n=1 Tax=Alteromonadaceae TaxID=72275 RepID=UPI003D07C505
MLRPSTSFKHSLLAIAVFATFACSHSPGESEVIAERERAAQAQADQARAQQEMIQVSGSRIVQEKADNFAFHSLMAPGPQELDYQGPDTNNENYQDIEENPVKTVGSDPVSTFSIDVDTGSYTNTRRMLTQGYLPPADAVRVEEFINYFDYQYPQPTDIDQPFSVNTAVSVSPWNDQRHLMRIGLKGFTPEIADDVGRNLVFLLDVSGSMNQENKLPLLKRSLTMLTNQMSAKDSVSIVVYAGASGVVLEPTPGNEKAQITQALDQLQAGGSTNGGAGIQLAYKMAEQAFIKDGINRVILATDGDFNVGMTDQDALIELIEQERDKGIALTTLGFGQGNYNDYLMEQLADAGNGNYAYIDTINEARKVLVDELQSTMQIIAKDVKIQVEFNPNQVAEYRLIGYENRVLAKEDFNNDKVDAGDIGAGHTVTALYELTLIESKDKFNDELRYQTNNQQDKEVSDELAFVKLRFKQPDSDTSELIQQAVKREQITNFDAQSDDYKFAVAVAGFAQQMKKSKFVPDTSFQWITETANATKGKDEFGYRSEFIQLVRNAQALSDAKQSDSTGN